MTIYSNNADRPVAGFLYVPDSMEARGSPLPLAPFPGVTNGLGEEVTAGDWGMDWTFTTLKRSEMDWWANNIGWPDYQTPPVNMRRFVWDGVTGLPAARLWGLDGNMMNFKVAVVYLPTWQKYQNGYFHDCVVRFRRMVYVDV
jgi:hypothetical protein